MVRGPEGPRPEHPPESRVIPDPPEGGFHVSVPPDMKDSLQVLIRAMSKSLGKHALVEFYRCSPQILNNADALEEIVLRALKTAGTSVINSFFHKFSPHGITGIIIIAESHFAIHTWPEFRYAAVDLFTCGDSIDNLRAMELIKDEIQSGHYSLMEISRGFMDMTVPGERG